MTSKIIKGASAPKDASKRAPEIISDSGGVIHKRIIDTKEQAANIIEKAEKEAAGIREEARKTLESAKKSKEDAIKKGYVEGESKGLAQVTEKLIRLDGLKSEFYKSAEPEVIKLVMNIAEKVIGKLALENKQVINVVVHQALEKALGDRITVRLNPSDYKNVMSDEHEFKDIVDRTKRLMFREDEAISKGGCIVETEVGTIDAQMETQLEAIKKALEI